AGPNNVTVQRVGGQPARPLNAFQRQLASAPTTPAAGQTTAGPQTHNWTEYHLKKSGLFERSKKENLYQYSLDNSSGMNEVSLQGIDAQITEKDTILVDDDPAKQYHVARGRSFGAGASNTMVPALFAGKVGLINLASLEAGPVPDAVSRWQPAYLIGSSPLKLKDMDNKNQELDGEIKPYQTALTVDFSAVDGEYVLARVGGKIGWLPKKQVIKGGVPAIDVAAYTINTTEIGDEPEANSDNITVRALPIGVDVTAQKSIHINPKMLDQDKGYVLAKLGTTIGYIPKQDVLLGTEAPQIVDPAYLVSTQPLQKSTSDANFKATVGTDIGAVTALKDIKINAEHEAVQGGSYVWAKDGQNQGLLPRDQLIKGNPEDDKPEKISAARALKQKGLRGMRTHLRGIGIRDFKYVANENQPIGPNIVEGATLKINENVKDETGQWVKASYMGVTGFVRLEKLETTDSTNLKDKITTTGAFSEHISSAEIAGEAGAAATESLSGNLDPMAGSLDIEKIKVKQGGLFDGGYYKDAPTPSPTKESTSSTTTGDKGSDTPATGGQNQPETSSSASQANTASAPSAAELHKARLDATVGAADALAGFIGMVKGYKSHQEKKRWSSRLDMLEGAAKVAGGTTKTIDSIAKAEGHSQGTGASDIAGKWTGSLGDGISAIKETFGTVKTAYNLYEKSQQNKLSSTEKFKGSMEVVTGTLKGAAAAVKSVRGFLEITKGGVSAGLTATLPVLTTAISIARIIMKVYDTIMAMANIERMEAQENQSTDPAEKKLAEEMKYINQKRRNRAGLQIGIELNKIAGDVATLSGAGAAAGIPLKAVAASAEVGMVGARTVKQFGRDKGWAGFNADKTTAKKIERRQNDAQLMMTMVNQLPTLPQRTDPTYAATVAQYKRVEALILATGVDMEALYELNGHGDEQFKLLVEAMAKRE
ncbi:MAG: hypothetical protein V9G20_19715, partial [Candidatus Promineifilaceae bacterium]